MTAEPFGAGYELGLLAEAGAEARRATARLHDRLRACRASGHPYRRLAEASGLPLTTVWRICGPDYPDHDDPGGEP